MGRMDDVLSDLADESVTDADTIGMIFDCDPQEFLEQLAVMIHDARKFEGHLTADQEQAHAYRAFESWLTEQAKQLHVIQSRAQNKVDLEVFYGD